MPGEYNRPPRPRASVGPEPAAPAQPGDGLSFIEKLQRVIDWSDALIKVLTTIRDNAASELRNQGGQSGQDDATVTPNADATRREEQLHYEDELDALSERRYDRKCPQEQYGAA